MRATATPPRASRPSRLRPVAATAATATALALAAAATAGPARPAPAACTADAGLAAYVAAMDRAEGAIARAAETAALLRALPTAHDDRWAKAARSVDLVAQVIGSYVEDSGDAVPPPSTAATHAALTAALIAVFRGAPSLSPALQVGDTATVQARLPAYAAAARAARAWRVAVSAAAARSGLKLPAWVAVPGTKPGRCPGA